MKRRESIFWVVVLLLFFVAIFIYILIAPGDRFGVEDDDLPDGVIKIDTPIDETNPDSPILKKQLEDGSIKVIEESDTEVTVMIVDPDLSEEEIREKMGIPRDIKIKIYIPGAIERINKLSPPITPNLTNQYPPRDTYID